MRLPLCFLNGSARGGKDKWEGVIENPPAGSPSRQIKRRRTMDSPHRISQTQTLIRPLVKRRSFRYNESWRSNAVVWEGLLPHRDVGVVWTPASCLYLPRTLTIAQSAQGFKEFFYEAGTFYQNGGGGSGGSPRPGKPADIAGA